MQQTPFDLWLRKKFLFVTSLYCNTLPEGLPEGLTIEEAAEESGARFRYRLETRNEDIIDDAAECFRMQNITYTSRVSDRKVWFGKYLNNRKKSVSFQLIWVVIVLGLAGFIFSGIPVKVWNSLTEEDTVLEEVAE